MNRLLSTGATVLVLAACGVVLGCKAKPPARPDILFITLDTQRADHSSAYGYSRPTTPRLARLAGNGVRFAAAYAPMPTTLPAHASMFTGLLPRAFGVLKNGVPLPGEYTTLAEVLANAGYRTAAFVSSFVVDHSFGLARGFATYDDRFAPDECKRKDEIWEGFQIAGGFCRRGALTRRRAEAWLEENGYLAASSASERPKEPYFLWLHLFDPHDPYEPPEAQRRLFPPLAKPPSELDRQIAAYDGEVHYADQEVGALLDRLAKAGRLDDTLVVVVGDHGEGLMDHGWMRHGAMLYEEAVRVPFVVSWPARLERGRIVTSPVQLADLLPTLSDLLGLAAPTRELDGMSLRPALEGTADLDPKRPIFLQRRIYDRELELGLPIRGEKLAVRLGDWKYIEARAEKTYELFDLASDPGELRNLYRTRRAEAAPLAAALHAWTSRPAAPAVPATVSDDVARRLEALGYAP